MFTSVQCVARPTAAPAQLTQLSEELKATKRECSAQAARIKQLVNRVTDAEAEKHSTKSIQVCVVCVCVW